MIGRIEVQDICPGHIFIASRNFVTVALIIPKVYCIAFLTGQTKASHVTTTAMGPLSFVYLWLPDWLWDSGGSVKLAICCEYQEERN